MLMNSACELYKISSAWQKMISLSHLMAYRGNTTLSSGLRTAWSLKFWNFLSRGGKRNGSLPKLKRHCWKDMKLAAAKKPDLKHTDGDSKHYRFLTYTHEDKQAPPYIYHGFHILFIMTHHKSVNSLHKYCEMSSDSSAIKYICGCSSFYKRN